jgi:glycosyltransferase involved in cell wall biosynthesis
LPLPARPFRAFNHVGELYEGRSVVPLLESLKRLVDSGRVDPAKIKIRLIGPAKASSLPDPAFLQAAVSAGWLELASPVPQDEAHFIMRTSDGLLLIQPHSTLQVPGKLYEYLQIGRPILALVPPHSSIERVLQRSGVPYRCVYSDDAPAAFDEAVLQFLALDSTPAKASEWFENEFNAERHAGMLARLIRDQHEPPR